LYISRINLLQPHSRAAVPSRLQSRIEIERDVLGRVIAETQRLYQTDTPANRNPVIEHEHRIAHQLDALGNRQSSELQQVGEIGWLLSHSRNPAPQPDFSPLWAKKVVTGAAIEGMMQVSKTPSHPSP
jgi:hypothetical protein